MTNTNKQLYAGQRAYPGYSADAVIERVMKGGERPAFPPGTPRAYEALARACW